MNLNIQITADKPGCVYRVGEAASLSLSASSADGGASAHEGVIHIRIDNYGARVAEERDVDLSTENPVRLTATRATPGFARVSVSSRTPGVEVVNNAGNPAGTYVFGIAFSPEEIRPGTPYPDDFMDFWTDAVRRLDETVPADPRMELVPERSSGPCNYWRVSFATYGGRRVYGWLSEPKAEGRHPVRISVPGAGIGACGTGEDPERINLTMNVHSYRQPEGDTPEAAAERQRLYEGQDEKFAKPNGVPRYCQAGIHKSREDYFYYASILGINRAVNWLAERPKCDPAAFDYYGTSQGGGFGLMLTALNKHITRSCIFVPAITDLLGSKIEGRQSGWPQIIENQAPENREAAEKWAPYFCGANFARQIKRPIRFVVGFCDMACAPHAVYAAYNVCPSSDKAILHGVGMGHGVYGNFYTELDRWLAARRQRNYLDMTWWDPYVENIADEDTYLRRKFRQDVTDRTTGVGIEALKKILAEIVSSGKASDEPWRITKAKLFAAQVERQSIDVSPLDWFPAIAVWDRNDRPIFKITKQDRAREVNAVALPDWVKREWAEGNADGDWEMRQDFDHSVPDWRVVLPLGFPGMKARLEKYAIVGDPFYESCFIAADAILAGIDRFIAQGKKNLTQSPRSSQSHTGNEQTDLLTPNGVRDNVSRVSGEQIRVIGNDPSRTLRTSREKRLAKQIACLERLRNGPPQTAYDMLMFVWIYFMFSEHLDGIQCRSLTELDVFLTPYYDADIAAGRTTEKEFREQLKHFFWQWGSIANYWNQPIGLGGTKQDGTTEFNHVSRIILDVMDECALTTPKFLVKVADNTPGWAWDKMLGMARRHRSIAFIGEEPAARALKTWLGVSDQDCREMAVHGCYEFSLRDGCNSTGVGHVNFLKIVEKMLAECKTGATLGTFQPFNLSTFQLFKAEYMRRLTVITDRCREIAFEFEKVLPDVNPANLMTIATENALRTRRDGFANGCPRGNNTSILAVGLGTAVDALLAVKELVFEKKELTLAELGAIMVANWEGREELRRRMLRSKRKWGNNDPEANALGAEMIGCFSSRLNGKPNSRGGIFLASGHCARMFIGLGEKTGATPDGRKAGEEMSKNLSPTMGADTEGATSLVLTLASSDITKLPGDYPLDMMLHPSVCAGDDGLKVMRTLVKLFHKNGGSVIQFTVFSPEELRDAQKHPEKYETLQVRVCGWNARWNDLARPEQDAYIRRAENVAAGTCHG